MFKLAYKIAFAIALPLAINTAFIFAGLKEASVAEKRQQALIVLANEEFLLDQVSKLITAQEEHILPTTSYGFQKYKSGEGRRHGADISTAILKLKEITPGDRKAELNTLVKLVGDDGYELIRVASVYRSLNNPHDVWSRSVKHAFSNAQDVVAAVESRSARDRVAEKLKGATAVESLKDILLAALITNAVMLLVIAPLFSWSFSRKWNRLLKNAELLACGVPAVHTLSPKDEIGQLDSMLRKLAGSLEEASQKERAMIQTTAQMLCSVDRSGKVIDVNQAVQRRFGHDPERLIGANLSGFFHADDREHVSASFVSSQSMENSVFECRMRREDGRYAHTEWTVKWSESDRRFFCVVLDITEKIEANNLKKDVLAMLTHDLRTPLTSLKLVLECAANGVFGTLNEKGIQTMSNAQKSSDYLINIIGDMLDIERFESGNLTIDSSPVHTEKLVNDAVSIITPNANKKKITIEKISEDFEICADGERITRTLVNLIGNAVKFAPANSEILVSVSKTASGARFTIGDQGPGIPEDKLELVFEKYRQTGSNSEGEKQGSGLGLAICRAIVQAHQGEIGVTSQLQKGSTFWFDIPLGMVISETLPASSAVES